MLKALVPFDSVFITFIWIRTGKVIARGAHRREPTRPRNLSILLARTIAMKIPNAVTRSLEKFCAQ